MDLASVLPEWSTWPKTGRGIDTLLFLQFHLESIQMRHDEVDAVIAFLNLVLMSDPLMFFSLKMNGMGQPLAFYESTMQHQTCNNSPNRIVPLPLEVAKKCLPRSGLKLLRTLISAELRWSDLIHCG